MGLPFTREMAGMVADKMIRSGAIDFSIYTDGMDVTLTSGGGNKHHGKITVGKTVVSQMGNVFRLNLNHYKTKNGKVLKTELGNTLYEKVNKMLEKQKAEAMYKNLLRKGNKPSTDTNRAKRNQDKGKDDGLEL